MKIGVFDSGIGGINVLKELIKKYPDEEYIFFGDSYHLPYGEKTKEELLSLGSSIIHFFEEQKVDCIVIACGTCSSLKEEYQKVTNIPIFDVITPTIQKVENYHSVALLATPSTIQNKTFETKLKNKGIEVYPLACPNFVPYIEGLNQGQLIMEKELESLLNTPIEAVILGCTHYPLLKEKIEECLKVPSIDMGKCLSERIEISDKTKASVTIYMSLVTPTIEKNVSAILEKNMPIIEKRLSV